MSDAGEVMDALVTAVETVSTFTAQRGLKLSSDLNDEEFPYACVFDPDETSEELPFLMERQTYEVPIWLYMRGETQEAALLKLDLVRDAIHADRTLGSVVRTCVVVDRRLREDPADELIAASLLVRAVEETGRIIRADVEIQVRMNPIYGSDFLELDTAVAAFIATHVTGFSRMTSDYITDRDSMAAEASAKYQLRIAPFTIDDTQSSNASTFSAHVQMNFYYHLPAATDEKTWIQGAFMPRVDGLLSKANWVALARVLEVDDGPTLSLEGDAGRQEE